MEPNWPANTTLWIQDLLQRRNALAARGFEF